MNASLFIEHVQNGIYKDACWSRETITQMGIAVTDGYDCGKKAFGCIVSNNWIN